MPTTTQPRISPCLWFDTQAEEAVRFYTSIFPNSHIGEILHYTKESAQVSGQKEGSVLTVAFELDGQDFLALNGGPMFKFTEAVSLMIHCANQLEVDHYWNRLSEGGDPSAQQCGWLKDRYGVSWQVVPTALTELLSHPDPEKARKAMAAMMEMKKIDIEGLRRAVA